MIPALIIWLCKRYIAPKPKENTIKKTTLIILFSILIPSAFAQTTKFAISRNGKVIGEMAFTYNHDGDHAFFTMNSKVNARFLFKIEVQTQDFSHFKNGKLLTSSTKRVVNGDAKDPKETKWTNNGYQILSGNKSSTLKGEINYNMMLLYAKEPLNIQQVYSDNFQCFLPIIRKGEHQYRINLPDGNYNDYAFENGICKKVTVNHAMYTIKMERI